LTARGFKRRLLKLIRNDMTNIRKSKHQPITLGQNVDFYPKKSKIIKWSEFYFRRRNSIFWTFTKNHKTYYFRRKNSKKNFHFFFINFQKNHQKFTVNISMFWIFTKKNQWKLSVRSKNSKSFIKKLEFYGQKLRFCHSVPISQIK